MAGVIPAIFAVLITVSSEFRQWVGQSADPTFTQKILQNIALVLSPGQPLYLVLFGAMIIFFAIFIRHWF